MYLLLLFCSTEGFRKPEYHRSNYFKVTKQSQRFFFFFLLQLNVMENGFFPILELLEIKVQ